MSDSDTLPADIEEAATSAVSSLIPAKSKMLDDQAFERFHKWCLEKHISNEADEKVCWLTLSICRSGINVQAFGPIIL